MDALFFIVLKIRIRIKSFSLNNQTGQRGCDEQWQRKHKQRKKQLINFIQHKSCHKRSSNRRQIVNSIAKPDSRVSYLYRKRLGRDRVLNWIQNIYKEKINGRTNNELNKDYSCIVWNQKTEYQNRRHKQSKHLSPFAA